MLSNCLGFSLGPVLGGLLMNFKHLALLGAYYVFNRRNDECNRIFKYCSFSLTKLMFLRNRRKNESYKGFCKYKNCFW